MIETELTRRLGIRVPIVQGGMQWVGVPQLVAAVANAGALGFLTALTQPNPEALKQAILDTRALTDKPFGVNITILPSVKSHDHEAYVRAAYEEGVRIFETAGSAPGKLVKFLKERDCFVIHKCTTIRHAKAACKLGVDILSIDGFECAGFPGEDDIGGLVLLAKAAKELKVPYIASGGIADGRGLAAVLALGAVGANMGTRFMCTVESPIHQNIKNQIVSASELNTTHLYRTLHNTNRVFNNKVAKQVLAIESQPRSGGKGVTFEDVKDLVTGDRGRVVYEIGDVDYGVWTVGLSIGLIDDIPTCEELVRRMEREAEEVIRGIGNLVKSVPAQERVKVKAKL
ncbi:inosine monophosphate dehydrogenase [Pyrrhoderma noxium]|uniref:Inosine monophosphate dehydrogenase n=1 Tax=Pyrrhoderma noxium TaxID=2282107 RepID=A0A286UUE4_9AGAM|nr:inosine monophosphate dehydrogenase [Pyrrhoderma noxium]